MNSFKRISLYSILFTSLAAVPLMSANAQTASYTSMTKEDCDSLSEHKSEFSTKEYKKRLKYCKKMEKKNSGHQKADPEQSTAPDETGGAAEGSTLNSPK